MVTEKATYIADLVPSEPTGDDTMAEADDQIRQLKSVLVNTFPKADEAFSVSSIKINNTYNGIKFEDNTTKQYVTLYGPNYDYDTPEDYTLKLNPQNEIVYDTDGDYPVGFVFWSILTLPQMQTKYGSKYVLANGDPVSDTSLYFKRTSKLNVPDVMGNRYIRPTFMKFATVANSNTYTYDDPQAIVSEMTSPIGMVVATVDKAHRHSTYHGHSHQRYYEQRGTNPKSIGGSGHGGLTWSSYVDYTNPIALGLESVPHNHTYTFTNKTPQSNELNRIVMNAFVRIN